MLGDIKGDFKSFIFFVLGLGVLDLFNFFNYWKYSRLFVSRGFGDERGR